MHLCSIRRQCPALIPTDCLMQDLTYSVKSHHDKKVTLNLLSSISGFFNSGEMSALVSLHHFNRPENIQFFRLESDSWHCICTMGNAVALHSQQLSHSYSSARTDGDCLPVITVPVPSSFCLSRMIQYACGHPLPRPNLWLDDPWSTRLASVSTRQ